MGEEQPYLPPDEVASLLRQEAHRPDTDNVAAAERLPVYITPLKKYA